MYHRHSHHSCCRCLCCSASCSLHPDPLCALHLCCTHKAAQFVLHYTCDGKPGKQETFAKVENWKPSQALSLGQTAASAIFLTESLLACSTLKGPVAVVALVTVGLSVQGTPTVTDEVQNNLHLLCESQWFNFNGLTLSVWRTLLCLNGNLEKHLENRWGFIGSSKKDGLKLIVPVGRHGGENYLEVC